MLGVPQGRAIASKGSNYWACPSWPLSDTLPYADSRSAEAALLPELRERARAMRAALIKRFDAAVAHFPGNDWIVGQRVRLLVDQGEYDRALAATHQCLPERPWCGELRGYVLAMQGKFAAADSTFARALKGLSPRESCEWNDISLLIDMKDRGIYATANCAEKDSLNTIFWWLADPMYTTPGNERRVEHFSRLVALELRSRLDFDERIDWREIAGGSAVREMVTRYGWPSYIWPLWMYSGEDLGCIQASAYARASCSTYEYTKGRLHTVPSWRAIADPPHATAPDWEVSEVKLPPLKVQTTQSMFVRREYIDAVARISSWWPNEHFEPAEPLVQLPAGQNAFLRRDSTIMFVAAVDLDSSLKRAGGSKVEATLLVTTRPDSLTRVARATSVVGTPLVLSGTIDSTSGIGAIEIDAAEGLPGARTRFGIITPPPLSRMNVGDIALSDVVILRAPDGETALPTRPDLALARMSGSLRADKNSKLGVYWETYGIAPTDTVEIAVWIERYTPQGILRRYGRAINVATDPNTPVAQSWTESAPGGGATVIPGRIPVISRSIVLDASKLRPGDYWLDVVMRKRGSEAVRSRRSFTVSR
jgi:hypothetical protein